MFYFQWADLRRWRWKWNNQKERFMPLLRSYSHILSGQRFIVHDPGDSQPINRTVSKLFKDGRTGRSIKDSRGENLKRRASQAVLQVYDDLEVERQVIGPMRQYLGVIHKRIIDDAKEYFVQPSVSKCAGNIRCKWRCHKIFPADFGSECWLLVKRLIMNKSTILLQ